MTIHQIILSWTSSAPMT